MFKKCFTLALILGTFNTFADQEISITGGNSTSLPKISIVNFTHDDATNNSITSILKSDLEYTGEFNVQTFSSRDEISNNPDYIIDGSIKDSKTVHLRVLNAKSKQLIINQDLMTNSNTPRFLGHTVSNAAYKGIDNLKGAFTSKIAYISHINGTYNIMISDYDGYNQLNVVSATAPLISLAWSSNNKLLAYSSLELGKPVVYVQDLYQGTRTLVADFRGSNSSPAFAPNASELAVTLTKDYGSHVFLINNSAYNHSSHAATLIKFGTIDTEASYSNSGQIIFTSNHDGGPQIFIKDKNGSAPKRLTLDLGNYNTTARFSHDGSKIVFINRNTGTLKTYFMDLANKNAYPLSLKTTLDISPSFAPNDKMVLLSSHNHMYIANTTGTSEKEISAINNVGEIIDQRWANN